MQDKEEFKSVRMQILLKPSTRKKLEKKAKQSSLSMNDIINRLLEREFNQLGLDLERKA